MKKYRMLVPVVMIGLLVASWYMLISNVAKTDEEYNQYLGEARKFAELGVTKYAIENYNAALAIRPSADIYVEVADYYESQGKENELISWSKAFFEKYPTEPKAYDCLLKSYVGQEDYKRCYDVIYTAQKRNVKSDYINQISEEIAYTYKFDHNTYNDVGVYSNNYCAVKIKDFWGYVDRYGNQRISAIYSAAAAYTKANIASVVSKDGSVYFINKSGEKVLVSKEKFAEFGILTDDMILAKKDSGKYVFVDKEFNVLHGEYDAGSAMNNGVAVVKEGGDWKIIDNNGEALCSTKYEDVIVDEKNIAYRNERLFVKTSTGIIMVDSVGNQIGGDIYEDAMIFKDSTYAAVKADGKWFFIDKEGKKKSDKTYEEARSFSNGMAAVKVNGKWGFVDSNEELKITAEFLGAKDFNEKGSCFVLTGDKWQLLKLYRLNREE